jgi:uncharacterized protein
MIRASFLVMGLSLCNIATPVLATETVPVLNALEAACAAQAASSFEPGFETTGRPVSMLDLDATVDACWAAMGSGENDFRMNAWMARAYYAAGQYADAYYFADRAAQNDVPLGLYLAGVLYSSGQGVQSDPAKGGQLLMAAVEAGFTPAFHALAISLINGTGVAVDTDLALDFLHFAADEGFGRAATTLGQMYFAGVGLPKDDLEAHRLMRLGAHFGDAEAFYELGHYAQDGIAGPVDDEAAVFNYFTAVDMGNHDALLPLAKLILAGRGTEMDPAMARELLKRAASLGNTEAQSLLDQLARS